MKQPLTSTLDIISPNEETPLMAPSNEKNKPSIWYIIVPLFFLTFSTGALFAPMLEFYTVIFCNRYYKSQDPNSLTDTVIPSQQCNIPEVQAIVSRAQAIIMFSSYITPLLLAGFYGSLSDRKGRRLIFKIASVGNVFLMTCYILTIQYQDIFGISLLFAGPLLRGLMAADNTMAANIHAYISDCTTPSERTIAFGHMIATLYLGASVGPSVASLLIKETGSILYVFYMSTLIHISFGCYVLFVLPESINFKEVRAKNPKRQSFIQSINIFSALQILFRKQSKYANRLALPLVAGSQFLLTIVMLPPILLYAMLQFGWTSYEGGLFISLTSFTKWIIMAILLPVLSKLYYRNKMTKLVKEEDAISVSSSSDSTLAEESDHDERVYQTLTFDIWMIRLGLMAEMIGNIAFGVVNSSGSFYAVGVLQSFATLSLPSIRSVLTTLVDPSEIGELFGAVAVMEIFAMLFSNLAMNSIYSAVVTTMPSMIFYLCGLVGLISIILAFLVKPTLVTKH